jgi:probable DNA metabolism protein
MKNKRIYICEDNIESIFTAIYDAWDSRYGHDNIRLDMETNTDLGYTMELFSDYIYVEADMNKAEKVARSIQQKISGQAYDMVCNGICSESIYKADIIYRFLIQGFIIGRKVVDHLANDSVMKLFELDRKYSRERHHFLGFLRFLETKNHVLVAKIKPSNDIIRSIAEHFAERLPNEDFIIYDEGRNTAIVHRSGYGYIYIKTEDTDINKFMETTEKEEEYVLLWKTFFESIAIKERKNLNLQRNNLPKKYRTNMTEFIS